jgi:hypothetical protein
MYYKFITTEYYFISQMASVQVHIFTNICTQVTSQVQDCMLYTSGTRGMPYSKHLLLVAKRPFMTN